jgi:branched-chain amino acid transport system substrate-binding protein
MVHAGTYSAVLQYLKAVQKAGTDDTEAVAKALHEMPVDDVFSRGGTVGANGSMIHDMYLLQVKKPAESKEAWDYFNVLATIPGKEAYIDPAKSGCDLVKQ